MRPTRFDPEALHVTELARQGASLAGALSSASMPRLSDSLWWPDDQPHTDRSAQWRVTGQWRAERGGAGQVWMALEVDFDAPVQCQRCLGPCTEPLRVRRRFRFVSRPEQAEELDEELEDDVLVQSSRFNLNELVEDELILAMPLVARHEQCEAPAPYTMEGFATCG